MSKKYKNFKNYHRILILIYFALLQGILFFMVVVYFTKKHTYFKFESSDYKLIAGLSLALISIILSFYLYRYLLQKAIREADMHTKLEYYSTAFITKMAILELAAMFNVAVFRETGNKYFLIFTAISLLGMMLSHPSLYKIQNDLKLEGEARSYIENQEKEFD